MPDPRHVLGRSSEDAVAKWLQGAGWEILARRFRAAGGGEIDLIALDPSSVLVGIEVRARRSPRTGAASETVDQRRIRRLARSLAAHAARHRQPHRGLRIDLVTAEPGSSPGQWRLTRLAGIG